MGGQDDEVRGGAGADAVAIGDPDDGGGLGGGHGQDPGQLGGSGKVAGLGQEQAHVGGVGVSVGGGRNSDVVGEGEAGIGRIVGEIGVDIDRDVEFGGQFEDEIDMATAVGDGRLVVGAAADDICAAAQAFAQQVDGAGGTQDAFLRKGDDL